MQPRRLTRGPSAQERRSRQESGLLGEKERGERGYAIYMYCRARRAYLRFLRGVAFKLLRFLP